MVRNEKTCRKKLDFYQKVLYYIPAVESDANKYDALDRLKFDIFYIMFSSYFLLFKSTRFLPGVFNLLGTFNNS